jgi:hypothetical protein
MHDTILILRIQDMQFTISPYLHGNTTSQWPPHPYSDTSSILLSFFLFSIALSYILWWQPDPSLPAPYKAYGLTRPPSLVDEHSDPRYRLTRIWSLVRHRMPTLASRDTDASTWRCGVQGLKGSISGIQVSMRFFLRSPKGSNQTCASCCLTYA